MNGRGKLLTHYLKNADKLIIPVYQRNYDWREEHCKKLYQDLVRTIQNKKRWHFFGGIVSVSDPMGSSSDYLVIDGQQRITTVSLLLLAMANLIKDGKVVPEDDDKNRAVYRLLETHRSEIETAYGKALTWVCQEGVRGCRIYDKMTEVSITKEDDWDAMIAFHTQQAKKLLSAMQPFWT